MKKIISVVGARPQFIKLGPLSRAVRKNNSEIIIHTGQHYDSAMSDAIFKDLDIPEPDYNLGIGSGNHGEQTGKILISIEEVLIKEKPDIVIVFGDTNSTLAGSLAAAKLCIRSIHVEAGLRSFNRTMPEEINRIVSDHTSDVLFAPTDTAMKNLATEGLEKKAVLSGDIMVDSVQQNLKKAIQVPLSAQINGSFYLLTLHRPYNVDSASNLEEILQKLSTLNKQIVFPVHPRTRNIILKNNIPVPSNITVIEPQGYLSFLHLEYLSEKIITDSGGIQKEAYLLKKPCITLRTETEWTETVEDGWNILVNSDSENIAEIVNSFHPVSKQRDVFGTDVANRMADYIDKL